MICPKCGKEGEFGYFGEPDHTDVIAMFSHKTGKTYTDVFGRTHPEEEHCFITVDELTSQPWYDEWKKKYEKHQEEILDKLKKDMEREQLIELHEEN